MPEPTLISSLAKIAIVDAYSRVLSKLTETVDAERETIQNSIVGIEQAINAQNQAHFRMAEMALRRGDVGRTLECLEAGLSVDKTNASAWSVYANLLSLNGRQDIAVDIYVKIFDWLGPNSSVVPVDICSAFEASDLVEVPSATPITKTIRISGEEWECREIGASSRGIAASFISWSGSFFTGYKRPVRIYFQPWHPESSISSERLIFSASDWPGQNNPNQILTHMTNRFAVVGGNSAIDLVEGYTCIRSTAENIASSFGKGGYGVVRSWDSDKCIRGVGIQFHCTYRGDEGRTNYPGARMGYSVAGNPTIIGAPRISAPIKKGEIAGEIGGL